MRTTPLNLATRPVRNERLPALLFLLAAFAVLLVTVQHAFIVYRLGPGRSRALRAEVEKLREESRELTRESGELRRVSVTGPQRVEWRALKGLVDRRTFWWSKLFEVLEEVLPRDVRIVSVTPRAREQERYIDFVIRVQDAEAGWRFAQALGARAEFKDVTMRSVDTADNEVEFQLSARYLAGETKQTAPTATPSVAAPPRVAQGEGRP